MNRRTFNLSVCGAAIFSAGCQRIHFSDIRALWVSRFEFSSADDIRSIFSNAASLGFTDIFFQVRAKGTVYYPSKFEPWAYELTSFHPSDTGVDPGWNPLAVAIESARSVGVRVHAYINVLPGWHGSEAPPSEVGQLWTKNPDWFMVDKLGNKMDSTRWYSFLNPANPAVKEHLSNLVRELAQSGVDGVHLDYIRYPDDFREFVGDVDDASERKARCDFSYDSVSLKKFGRDPSSNYRSWSKFRRDAVSDLVKDLSRSAREANPLIYFSASTIARPDKRPETYQDGSLWARKGWVDWVIPMMYGSKDFQETVSWNRRQVGYRCSAERLVAGIYMKHEIPMILEQLRIIRSFGIRGVSIFSYSALFEGDKKTAKGEALSRFWNN